MQASQFETHLDCLEQQVVTGYPRTIDVWNDDEEEAS